MFRTRNRHLGKRISLLIEYDITHIKKYTALPIRTEYPQVDNGCIGVAL